MKVEVTIKTTLEFDEVDDIEDAMNLLEEFSPDEIIEEANNKGCSIDISVKEM